MTLRHCIVDIKILIPTYNKRQSTTNYGLVAGVVDKLRESWQRCRQILGEVTTKVGDKSHRVAIMEFGDNCAVLSREYYSFNDIVLPTAKIDNHQGDTYMWRSKLFVRRATISTVSYVNNNDSPIRFPPQNDSMAIISYITSSPIYFVDKNEAASVVVYFIYVNTLLT